MMLNISSELKSIYRNDQFPFTDSITPKDVIIYFPALDLTIETDQIVDDSFSLDESLCSENDLIFGSCEATKIKFTVADIEQDLTGQWFTISQVIEGYDPMPLSVYKVDSCVKQDDLRFKDITAYNMLKDTDVDVADWYNSLFPVGNETYTLKQFRESLLDYLGIEYENENWPNDSMIVEKTIDTTQLSAREVLRCCVELQGAFGQINRQGKFYHKVLAPAYGDYPTGDYPTDDYPIAENDTSYAMPADETVTYNMLGSDGVRYEDYTVKEIDKLIIRTDEDDIGAIVGTGSNAYVIQGNFLVFGKSASELEQIARNAYAYMAKRPYRPYSAEIIGLPYIEPGDYLEFETGVRGYVLQRTLTGIQALKDNIEAPGSKEREQHFGVNTEIIQLKRRTTRIKKDVEGVRVEVENLETATNTRFEQTDQAISAEAVRAINAETELSGRLDVMAGKIVLKVDANGKIAAVALDADPSEGTTIKIKADNVELEGFVTANSNFKILLDGSIEAVNGKFSGTITGSNISGGTIVSVGTSYSTTIENGMIQTTYIAMTGIGYSSSTLHYPGSSSYQSGSNTTNVSAGSITTPSLNCNLINGGTPITSLNISSQSVSSANSATYANYAINANVADYAIAAGSAPLTTEWAYAIKTNVGYLASQMGISLPAAWPS